jgi:hypothetical protein
MFLILLKWDRTMIDSEAGNKNKLINIKKTLHNE